MDRTWPTAARLATVVLAGALGGCGDDGGSSEAGKPPATRPANSAAHQAAMRGDCQRVGRIAESRLLLCSGPRIAGGHGLFVLDGGVEREAGVLPPGPTPTASDAGKAGHWAWAALSPDGMTILAQWSAECEVPIAFLVEAAGGKPLSVTGEDDWAKSPESIALGWTVDGRAIVFLPKGPACGTGAASPGIYLYSRAGAGELLPGICSKKCTIEPSTRARTVPELRTAAS